MVKKTSQEYFWALSIAGIVYLAMTLVGQDGFVGLMVSGSAFSWALKGDKEEHDDEVQSLITPPRKWRDIKKGKG